MKLIKILLAVFSGVLLLIGSPGCSKGPRQYTVSQLQKLLVTKGEFNYEREKKFVNKEITVIGKISNPLIEQSPFGGGPSNCLSFDLIDLKGGYEGMCIIQLPWELQKKIPTAGKKAKVTGIFKTGLITGGAAINATSWEYIK